MAKKRDEVKLQKKQASGAKVKSPDAKPVKADADNRTGLKAIKKDNSYLASFPELNTDPIMELDREGNLRYQNPACQRLFPDIGTLGLKHPLFTDWVKVLKELQAMKPGQPVIREISVGNSVETIADARIAMEKIGAGVMYDVILTDVRMPGMSGIEMYTRIVEKMPAMKNKIIFITGDVMGADIKNFLTQNNLAFLAKPFDIESLQEKISAIMNSGRPENDISGGSDT